MQPDLVNRILITGGAGFIGSHLADALLRLGNYVVAVDNLETGTLANIVHLKDNPNFRFVEANILDGTALQPLVESVDYIFHLAASVGVELVLEKSLDTLKNNTFGTDIVLKLAQHCGNKKVVLTSTSEVYGNSVEIPFREDSALNIGPPHIARWGYAVSKLYDEFLAMSYYQEMGLPITICRLFNTVGPRQSGRYGMVLPRFVSQATLNVPITVYGDGLQTRCFTHVRDVADAMVRISHLSAAEGEIFNLGSQNEITIDDLANLVKKTLNSESDIVYVPYSEAYQNDFVDIRHRVPDISKIKTYIEYHPSPDLASIVLDIAKYSLDD